MISSQDENKQNTTFSYDALWRLNGIAYPDGGKSGTTYDMTTLPGRITQSRSIDANRTSNTETDLDWLGRSVRQVIASDPQGVVYSDTVYDSLGRIASVSNPYRSSGELSYGNTLFSYDALGRTTLKTQPDGTTWSWNYSANANTETDERGQQHTRTTDALGRLSSVQEPNGASTTYTYDALDNLVSSTQAGVGSETARIRSFTYDSLSRLLTATNPETGTVCYGQWSGSSCTGGYDANGNLLAKTDARSVVTTYSYDMLNRLTSKTFAGIASPSSCYLYDGNGVSSSTNTVGRLSAEWTQMGACPQGTSLPAVNTLLTRKIINSYDAMGRVTSQRVCNRSGCVTEHPLPLSYDLAGNLLTYTDGLGKNTFTLGYDGVGRMSSLASSFTDLTHPATLFNAKTFQPLGWDSAIYGNAISATRHFDSRERVTDVTVKAGVQ